MKKPNLKTALIFTASLVGCVIGVSLIVKATKEHLKNLDELIKLSEVGRRFTVPKESADIILGKYRDYVLAVSESEDGKTLVIEVLGWIKDI